MSAVMQIDGAHDRPRRSRRFMRRRAKTGMVLARAAMASWVVLAAMPVVVAIIALT